MKTLVVTYLPSMARSVTKKLVDYFVSEAKSKDPDIEVLDLLVSVPDFFDAEKLAAYVQRNYQGQSITAKQLRALENMDKMTAQLKAADVIVIAYPMHNFSMPALVKAYFDSVIQKGVTWDIQGEHDYVGLLKDKKALILTSTGGVFSPDNASWEHSISLAKLEFGLMGFSDIRAVSTEGTANLANIPAAVKKAQEEIDKVVKDWY